jgi:hypothetical protein
MVPAGIIVFAAPNFAVFAGVEFEPKSARGEDWVEFQQVTRRASLVSPHRSTKDMKDVWRYRLGQTLR